MDKHLSAKPASAAHGSYDNASCNARDEARSGSPMSLADGIQDFFSHVDPEGEKARRAARNLDAYRRAVILRTWRNSPEAAKLILDHTNAFYVRKDDVPRKGPYKDKPLIVCEICTDDSVVRSEIDLKREMFQLDLAYEGLTFDELRIKSARFGMKSRHPFRMSLADILSFKDQSASAVAQPAIVRQIDELQTVKRAFCIALGPNAAAVLDQICAAHLEGVRFGPRSTNKRFTAVRRQWLHLFVCDMRVSDVVSVYESSIIKAARELGLYINKIQVHSAPFNLIDARAFPRCGQPVVTNPRRGSKEGNLVIEAETHNQNDRLIRSKP